MFPVWRWAHRVTDDRYPGWYIYNRLDGGIRGEFAAFLADLTLELFEEIQGEQPTVRLSNGATVDALLNALDHLPLDDKQWALLRERLAEYLNGDGEKP